MVKAIELQKPATLQLFWCWHSTSTLPYASPRRVWRSDWASDEFVIMHSEQFLQLKTLMEMFYIPITKVDNEDD